MKPDNLHSELRKRLRLYDLDGYVAWTRSNFRTSLDGTTLTAELVITDSSWLGAVMEVSKERCKQLEQKYEPISIQAFFRPVWNLVHLRRVRDTAKDCEKGVPLRPAIRYLATLKSGMARMSAVVDVQCDSNNEKELEDAMVKRCVDNRLSIQADDVWNPEVEPLLLMGLDAVKHYAAMLKEQRKSKKKV